MHDNINISIAFTISIKTAVLILKVLEITPKIYGVMIPPIAVSAVKIVIAKAQPCNDSFETA